MWDKLKGFIYADKAKERDQAVMKIRSTINKLTLRRRKTDDDIQNLRRLAKESIAKGDVEQAKQYLKRKKALEVIRRRYDQQIMNLEDTILALQTSADTEEVGVALSHAKVLLDESVKMLDPAKMQKMLMDIQTSIGMIMDASDILATDVGLASGEIDLESEVDSELTRLETEVALEKEASLPPIASDKPVSEKSSDKEKESESVETSDSDDILRELEELKKEAEAERKK